MTSMTSTTGVVTGGVDTHGQTHHAAVLDPFGRQLGDREFPTTPAGYRALRNWLRGHGELERVGIEGTGTYGAALTRHLRSFGVTVVEVDRPDRTARRAKGKSDPLDAYAAARAALARTASGCPKTRDGRVESIRALRVARSSAIKARGQATNQIKALLVTAPAELREQLRTLNNTGLITACARLRPTYRPLLSRAGHQDCTASPGPPPPAPDRGDHRGRQRSSDANHCSRPPPARPVRRRHRGRRAVTHHRG